MNDEIREILENIKRQNEWDGIEYFKTPLSTKDANKLLDYITNLQTTVNNCKQENKAMKIQIEVLEEINIREVKLKERYQLEKEVYKLKNEKGIEYIKGWQSFPHTNGSTHNELRNLLNILQNGSEDND